VIPASPIITKAIERIAITRHPIRPPKAAPVKFKNPDTKSIAGMPDVTLL
jgi:hypothetical protein